MALIAWVEYRHHFSPGAYPLRTEIPSLFAAIVGSISFWGSNIAFGKLQAVIPGRPIKLPGHALVNLGLLLVAVVSAVILAAGTHSQALFILGVLLAAVRRQRPDRALDVAERLVDRRRPDRPRLDQADVDAGGA